MIPRTDILLTRNISYLQWVGWYFGALKDGGPQAEWCFGVARAAAEAMEDIHSAAACRELARVKTRDGTVGQSDREKPGRPQRAPILTNC